MLKKLAAAALVLSLAVPAFAAETAKAPAAEHVPVGAKHAPTASPEKVEAKTEAKAEKKAVKTDKKAAKATAKVEKKAAKADAKAE